VVIKRSLKIYKHLVVLIYSLKHLKVAVIVIILSNPYFSFKLHAYHITFVQNTENYSISYRPVWASNAEVVRIQVRHHQSLRSMVEVVFLLGRCQSEKQVYLLTPSLRHPWILSFSRNSGIGHRLVSAKKTRIHQRHRQSSEFRYVIYNRACHFFKCNFYLKYESVLGKLIYIINRMLAYPYCGEL